MFGFKTKPTTVAAAIAGLVEAVDNLTAVGEAQSALAEQKNTEAQLLSDEANAATLESNRAHTIAGKLREITEPKEAE